MCVYTYYTRHIENDREIDTQRNRYVRYVCTDAWTPFIRCLDLNFCAPHSSQSNASKKLCCYGQKTPENDAQLETAWNCLEDFNFWGKKTKFVDWSLLLHHFPDSTGPKKSGAISDPPQACYRVPQPPGNRQVQQHDLRGVKTNDSHFAPEIKPTILWEYSQRIELNKIYIINHYQMSGIWEGISPTILIWVWYLWRWDGVPPANQRIWKYAILI